MAFLRALLIRERYIAKLSKHAQDLEDRVHRLEIANRQQDERLDVVEGAQERLRKKQNGLAGGRPATISEIPRGDKAALRRALLPNRE